MRRPFPVTDAQVHLITPSTPERPWPRSRTHYAHQVKKFDADDLIRQMDSAGVDRAVIVPPSFEGDRNDVSLAAAKTYPTRIRVMGRVNLRNPANEERLAHWTTQFGLVGIRLTFSRGETMGWLSDGTADWIWPVAAKHDLPIMIFAPGRTEEIREVAQSQPTLRLMVDHLGIPTDKRDEDIFAYIHETLSLADLPNISVKLSGLPGNVTEPFPFVTLHDYIRRAVEIFGVDRCAWGSDLTRLGCSYQESICYLAEALSELSCADLTRIYDGTIREWLSWE